MVWTLARVLQLPHPSGPGQLHWETQSCLLRSPYPQMPPWDVSKDACVLHRYELFSPWVPSRPSTAQAHRKATPAAARPGPPPTPLCRTGALEGRRPQQRLLGGPRAPCPGHCGGGALGGGGCSRHPAGRVAPAQLLHGNPREGGRVPAGGAAQSPEGAEAEGRRVREAVPCAGAAGAGAGRADSQPVRGGPQNGAGGQREAGGSREAAKGGAGQDRHAAGGGDCPEDPGHHVHAGLPQSRAASATAEPHQGWAPQRTLAAPELQQGPGPHRAPCPRARPRAGQGGQGGRHHAVLRVPGLEGSAHTGQGLPLPGQGVPRGCGPLPGLHHARALCAGAGCRGGQHAHHRASGLTHAAWHEGRCGVWPHQQVCPERADQPLPPPHPAWGLREPLLHLAILPGQDHSGVQLLHLHPLHPAGPGAAGCGADVLGGHEAAEGDVAGQAGLFPAGGLGCSLAGAAPALAQQAPSQSSKEGPVPTLDGRTDRAAWSSELRPPPPPDRAHQHLPKAPWAEVLGIQEGTLGRAHPPLWQLSLPGREGQFQGSRASEAGSPCPSTRSTLAPASLPQGSRLGGHGPPPPCSVSQSGGPQAPPPPFPTKIGTEVGKGTGLRVGTDGTSGCPPTPLLQTLGSTRCTGPAPLDTPPHRAPPWLECSSICLIKEALLVGPHCLSLLHPGLQPGLRHLQETKSSCPPRAWD
ncbi:guanine nucleotide exchange factor for Rab-3A isoform X4 [Fukomys damarensis]|uniref:guanine nucleotide exchange factor for Rab-3A isoform X4 n=1 Tax=Fukomys damarensis TaxID=885580 RepID=UPI001454F158|nr:guanine nucleotide exchange factor for Rab-3A isoform X4 [Fukomys damarensis]